MKPAPPVCQCGCDMYMERRVVVMYTLVSHDGEASLDDVHDPENPKTVTCPKCGRKYLNPLREKWKFVWP